MSLKVQITCNYCDYKWEKWMYNKASIQEEMCPRCRDTSLKMRDKESDAVDYYQGCPPFPKKTTEKPKKEEKKKEEQEEEKPVKDDTDFDFFYGYSD